MVLCVCHSAGRPLSANALYLSEAARLLIICSMVCTAYDRYTVWAFILLNAHTRMHTLSGDTNLLSHDHSDQGLLNLNNALGAGH